jgi:hypothetical protein
MVKGHIDVIGVVGFFEVKDEAGMEAGVSGVGGFEPGKEGVCMVAKGEESVSDRFKTIADLFGGSVLGFFRGFPGPLRETLMMGHHLDLGAIDEHVLLGGFQGEDIGHILVGDGVAIGFKIQEPIDAANPQGHFGGIVIVKGQGLKSASFLLHEELKRRAMGRFMDMFVGSVPEPPLSRGLQVIEILERACVEEVFLYILEGRLDFSLRLRPAHDDGLAVVMGNEGDEGRVVDRAACFPSQKDCFLPVVQTVLRNPLKMVEGVLVPADQGEELAVGGKVDILLPGKAQDIGKTENLGLAGSGEGDGVGAPIHLTLDPGICLKSDDRIAFGLGVQLPESVPEDADPALIALHAELLVQPLSGHLGVFLQ